MKYLCTRLLLLIVLLVWGWMVLGGVEWMLDLGLVETVSANDPIRYGAVSTILDRPPATEEDTWVTTTIDTLVKFLSRAWIIPASLAGELMTNEVIYWKSFHFSELLFKFWQFIRTLALYGLGFMFLYKLAETFAKWGNVQALGGTVVKTLIAGVLIPMSRWMVAALIDLSIIATATVSALPLNAMEQLREELNIEISVSEVVYIKDYEIQPLAENTKQLDFNDLIPDGDSVAWTLVFMWAGIMRLDQSLSLAQNEWEETRTADQLVGVFIRMIMVVMLVVPMFVLLVVNIVRVAFIRLWIVTVPFIILDLAFDGPLSKNETFNMSNIMWLIFQPVVVVGTLSVGILIVMGMYWALMWTNQDVVDQWMGELINVTLDGDKTARVGTNSSSEVFIDGDLLGQSADLIWWGIWRMVVSLFMVFLLRSLLKVGFSTSKLTEVVSKGIYGFSEQILSATPIVPIPGVWMQSVSSLQRASRQLRPSNLIEKKLSYEAAELENMVKWKLKIWEQIMDSRDGYDIDNAINSAWKGVANYWTPWKQIKKMQKSKSLRSSELKPYINKWIMKNSDNARKMFGSSVLPAWALTQEVLDKLWEEWSTEWVGFRQAINGLLSANLDEKEVTEKELMRIISDAKSSGRSIIKNKYEALN